jgi:uncharacterized protein (TIGR02453 family)
MAGINTRTIDFLKDLKKNNNRVWFNDNKSTYIEIKEDFITFIERLLPGLAIIDPKLTGIEPRKTVFRINRDVRFSDDKSPYKSSIAAVLMAGGRKKFSERAGFYIHVEPGNSLIAGGAYLPPSGWISSIRKKISSDGNGFREIIGSQGFKRFFNEMDGDKLKGAPRGFTKDHPEIDLLRYKSFLAVNNLSDKDVLRSDLSEHFIKVSRELHPLNEFLND